VEYRRNASNNPAEFLLEMSGIPGEYRRNAGNNSGGFQRNSGGIRLESAWNSGKIRAGIPGLFLLGKLFKITHLYKNVTICTVEPR